MKSVIGTIGDISPKLLHAYVVVNDRSEYSVNAEWYLFGSNSNREDLVVYKCYTLLLSKPPL